jgi:hypothetical protein
MSDKPQIIEVGASVSTGGKIQLKKYELSADYFFNLNAKWAIPEGMSESDAEAFRYEQVLRMRKELEPIAQAEIDDLMEQKADLSSNEGGY